VNAFRPNLVLSYVVNSVKVANAEAESHACLHTYSLCLLWVLVGWGISAV